MKEEKGRDGTVKRIALVVFFTLVVHFSCSSDSSVGSSSQLFGVEWKLQSFTLNGDAIVPVPVPDNYSITFDPAGNNLSIRADCNGCGGTYAFKGAALSIDIGMCTQAFCGAGSLDKVYLAALDGAVRYTLAAGELRIFYPGGFLLFTD